MIGKVIGELLFMGAEAVLSVWKAVKAAKRGDEEEAAREIVEAGRHYKKKREAKERLKRSKKGR